MSVSFKNFSFFKNNKLFYNWYGEEPAQEDPPGTPPPKTFTQDEVNKIVQERVKKEKAEKEKLTSELRTLQQNANLTKEEKESLASRIEQLENESLTAQEIAAKKQKQLTEEYESKIKQFETTSNSWKNKFEETLINQALVSAAATNEAYDTEQITMMFRGNTSVKEILSEDGKPTGSFIPVMKIKGLNKDGKTWEDLELPVDEAVSKLKKDNKYPNLFKSQLNPGTGQHPGGNGKNSSNNNMPDPSKYNSSEEFNKAYQEWRNNYNLDGSSIKKV